MKILKYSTLIICLLCIGLSFQSCEDNDTDISTELVARFTQTINQSKGTVTFINLSENAASYNWDFGDGTSSIVINPEKTYNASGTYDVKLTVSNKNSEIAIFQDIIEIKIILIINGDFENGSEGWIVGVDDNVPAPVVTENDNSFYEVNITNPDPNQPFLVNVSQKVAITQGEIYVLTFEAWSDGDRTLIAGIGLSGGDFSNDTQTVNLTDTQQQFEITLSSQEFGALDARVLFDSNGDAGLVRIDNVSLSLQ
jgi:hypothetical protein